MNPDHSQRMNEEVEGVTGPKFSRNLWTSIGRHPEELNCERAYYDRHVDVSKNPSVMYRFVTGTKSRGHSSTWKQNVHGTARKETERRDKRTESRCTRLDGDDGSDRPFTSSLRRKFQHDSKEALCLLGLKKKIARLYAQDMESQQKGKDRRQTGNNNRQGCKGPSTSEAETIPVKRKRGRPPKNKNNSDLAKRAVAMEEHRWKCESHSDEPLKVRITRSKKEEKMKDAVDAVAPVRLYAARRARPTEGSLLMDASNSSSCSDSTPEEEQEEAEDGIDEKGFSRRRNVLDDEALALQLHLDLNAPTLRRRRRSGGLLSPSSSEQ